MSAPFEERVLDVRHWTDSLFSFTTTRNAACRFKNGQFVMLGLEVDGRPLMRAYSIASPNHAEELEFFSIKVQNGPLTSRLQHLSVGDSILIGRKPTGTLVLDNLRDGRNLYLLATGTGLAPFLATIRDPETYERFATVVLVHGVRTQAELAYRDLIEAELPRDDFLGELVGSSLRYYPTVTREPFHNQGRIPDLIEFGQAVQGPRSAAARCGMGPRDDLRQPATSHDPARAPRRQGFRRGQHRRAGGLCDRKGVRREVAVNPRRGGAYVAATVTKRHKGPGGPLRP